jgi:pimeloyl-ACP methyl ester carboxylesterase
MDDLAQQYDVIAPDHPGFGGSETPAWLDDVHDLSNFYFDFLRALNIDRVHVIGHALGGWIACDMAIRNDKPIRSLTLIAPAGLRFKGLPKLDVFLCSREDLVRKLYHDEARADEAVGKAARSEGDDWQRMLMTTARLAWQPRFADPSLAKWLHRIQAPALVMWGAFDRVLDPGYGKAFCDLLSNAKLQMLTNSGHLPFEEERDVFVQSVRRFIDGVSA